MKKFATGGESDFYNNLADTLLSGSQNVQQQDEPIEQPEQEETPFIKNLRSYDDEQSKQDDSGEALYEKIKTLLDDKLSQFSNAQMEYDWFADADGQEDLAGIYNTQSSVQQPSLQSGNSFKENIGAGESGGNYFIANPQPGQTAFGKYQFTKAARQDAYNSSGGASKWGNFANYEKAFATSPEIQEQAMDARMAQAEKLVGSDPIAQALYHYAPKFGVMYKNGELDLDKKPSDYGIGVGVKNPTFREFLKSHHITK